MQTAAAIRCKCCEKLMPATSVTHAKNLDFVVRPTYQPRADEVFVSTFALSTTYTSLKYRSLPKPPEHERCLGCKKWAAKPELQKCKTFAKVFKTCPHCISLPWCSVECMEKNHVCAIQSVTKGMGVDSYTDHVT